MKHRSSKTTANRLTVASIATIIALLAAAILGASAEAKSKSFQPVRVSKRSAAFRPHVPKGAKIHKATAQFHSHGRIHRRHIGARRIRYAVKRGSVLRMVKPRNGSHLRLYVSYSPPTKPQPPVSTDPGTTDPGTTDPGTTDPGTTDPGTTDPGTTDPGTTDPGTTDPGTTDPGTTDPGTTDPGTTDPGTTDPGTTDPGTTDPGTTDPGTTDPGTTDPGTTDPGTTDPGTTDPGTTDPGTTDPGTTDPGTTDPGTTTPDDCTFGSFSPANLPGACWKPYSASSPFNRKLPSDIRQTSNSVDVAARVGGFGKGPQIVTGVADTEADYDHPIYYSDPTDPKYTVHCTQPWGTCEGEGESINIPAQAKPAGGPDGHMAVIDQATDTEYDLYAVQSKSTSAGTITVQWAGKTAIGTAGADGLGSNATAGHFGLAAGIIRPSELASGHIDHALAMAVKCTNDTSVAPAGDGVGRTCDSMGLSDQNAPAMGQHFYLNMTPAQIDALDVPQWRKTILTTMATYGMYVEDTGADHNGWALIVESGSSYTSFGQPDPWVELGKKLGVDNWHSDGLNRQLYMYDLQGAVNWGSKLRVADPCVGLGTC